MWAHREAGRPGSRGESPLGLVYLPQGDSITKKLFTLTLTAAWLLAIAAPPVADAAMTNGALLETACALGLAMDTCESTYTVDHGDGDTTTCSLKNTIPIVIDNPDGSTTITADCDYGSRGIHRARH